MKNVNPLPPSIDGIVFTLILVLTLFLGRENPHFHYPGILWCFGAFFAFNVLNIFILATKMPHLRRTILAVCANILLVALIVHYSGGRHSYFWAMFLLPVFNACLAFGPLGVLATTAVILAVLGAFHTELLLHGDLNESMEALVKFATIAMSAPVVLRTAYRERKAIDRLQEERRRITHERDETRNSLQHMDRLATLGTLTASVAHEINSPLASILGYSQLTMMPGASEQVIKDSLPRIESSAKRCKRIVDDMLRFSRKEKNERKPADINALVKECAGLKKYDWLNSTLTVGEVYATGLPAILLSPAEFQQVIFNLLTNAQQAVRGAGKPDGRIEIRTSLKNGRVLISVRDNGPGIPPKILRRIWEPFFTTKGEKTGTGLGLSISKKIVEEQGGRLTAAPVPGGGVEFTVGFPVEGIAPAKRADAARDASPPEPSDTILLAEDDAQNAKLLRVLLASHRMPVVIVGTFDEALTAILKEAPRLLITDLHMPGMSALDFFRTLEHEDLLTVMDVLIVSGSPPGAALEEYLENRGFPRLGKPFNVPEFHKLLDGLVGKR